MILELPSKPAPLLEINVQRVTLTLRGGQVEVVTEGFESVAPDAKGFVEREMLIAGLRRLQGEEQKRLQNAGIRLGG